MTSNSDNGHTREYWAQQAADALIDDLQANGGVGTTAAQREPRPTPRRRDAVLGHAATVVSSLGANNAAGTEALITATGSGNTPFKTGMATGAADLTANKRMTDTCPVCRSSSDALPVGWAGLNPDGTSTTNPPWANTSGSQRPTLADGTAFLAAADQIFSIAVGTPGVGSGSSLVDTALMQALAKPNDANHYRNIVDSSGLPAFFANIFSTIACTGTLQIPKTVSDGTNFPGGTFGFSVDCGAAGWFTPTIDVAAGGATGSTTVSGIADAASCTVSETLTPSAGSGWSWGTATYATNPVAVVSGKTAQLTVANCADLQLCPAPLEHQVGDRDGLQQGR